MAASSTRVNSGRAHVAGSGGIDLAHCGEQFADAAAMPRRDEMQRCEIGELQPLLDLLANQVALLRGNVVPFIDGEHQRRGLVR